MARTWTQQCNGKWCNASGGEGGEGREGGGGSRKGSPSSSTNSCHLAQVATEEEQLGGRREEAEVGEGSGWTGAG